MMDRSRRIELVQRSLGIRHKLKVHESVRPADNHEDMALNLLARWELEDELKAIEELIAADRLAIVAQKRKQIDKEGSPIKKKK